MGIFISVLVALVILNALLLLFSNSRRESPRSGRKWGHSAQKPRKAYNFKSADSELNKAV